MRDYASVAVGVVLAHLFLCVVGLVAGVCVLFFTGVITWGLVSAAFRDDVAPKPSVPIVVVETPKRAPFPLLEALAQREVRSIAPPRRQASYVKPRWLTPVPPEPRGFIYISPVRPGVPSSQPASAEWISSLDRR